MVVRPRLSDSMLVYIHILTFARKKKQPQGGLTPPLKPNPKPAMLAYAHAPLIYIRVTFQATQQEDILEMWQITAVSHPYRPYRVRLNHGL